MFPPPAGGPPRVAFPSPKREENGSFPVANMNSSRLTPPTLPSPTTTPQSTPVRPTLVRPARSLPRPPKRHQHARRPSGSGFKLPPSSTTPLRSQIPLTPVTAQRTTLMASSPLISNSPARLSPRLNLPSPRTSTKIASQHVADAPAVPDLSNNWRALKDPSSGKTYYFNEQTRETTWTLPSDAGASVNEPEREVPAIVPTARMEPKLTEEKPMENGGHHAPAVTTTESSVEEKTQELTMTEPVVEIDRADDEPKAALEDVVTPSSEPELPPHWKQLDHDGKPYYYHELTGETRWDKPEDEFVVVDTPAAAPISTSSSLVMVEHDDESSGWVEKIDQDSGKTYFYHHERNITQWERPDELSPPEESAPENMPAVAIAQDSEAYGEEPTAPVVEEEPLEVEKESTVSVTAVEEDPPIIPLPAGWIEQVDPGSGKTYYYNAENNITQWDRPGEEPETENIVEEERQEEPTPEPVPRHDDPTDDQEPAESAADEPEDMQSLELPDGWVAAEDPSSGQTYYFHAESGQTSWELPQNEVNEETEAVVEDSVVANPEETTTSDLSEEQAVPAPGNEELPQGWIEAVDPSSGKTYYFNELDSTTSWERPEHTELGLTDEPAETSIDEGETMASIPETPEEMASVVPEDDREEAVSDSGTVDSSEVSPGNTVVEGGEPSTVDDDGLPEGWVEVVDESSGDKYFFNEATGDSSWEKPDKNVPPQPVGEEELPEGWVAMLDEDTGEKFYYNEESGKSSWEHPLENEKTKDTISSLDLPEGWEECVDSQSGEIYFYNSTDGTSSWDKPTGQSTSDKESSLRPPPRATVSFGFGGKLCVQKADTNGTVGVFAVDTFVRKETILRVEKTKGKVGISGPLCGSNDENLEKYLSLLSKEENSCLIWKLLRISSKHAGKLRSENGIKEPNSPEKALVDLLVETNGTLGLNLIRDSSAAKSKLNCLRKVQDQLILGQREEAVEEALRSKDYSIALVIASMCKREMFQRVVKEYKDNSLTKGSPLLTACTLFSGDLDVVAADSKSPLWDCDDEILRSTWKGHLATVISNRGPDWDKLIVSLGDRLLDLDEVDAAHVCYLVAGCPVASPARDARLTLIGCNFSPADLSLSTEESVLGFECTEALEWIRRKSDPNAVIESLQPFKLLYATQLADLGLSKSALRYAEDVINCLETIPIRNTDDTVPLPLSVLSSASASIMEKAKSLVQRIQKHEYGDTSITKSTDTEQVVQPTSLHAVGEAKTSSTPDIHNSTDLTVPVPVETPADESEVDCAQEDPALIPNLPSGWAQLTDEQSGKIYYYNETTGQTSWELPTEGNLKNGDEVPAEMDSKIVDQLLPGWTEVADENGGPSYYYHEEDGTTTWDRPISAAGPTEPESSPQEDAVLAGNEYEPSELSMHHTLQQDSDSLHANQNGDVPAEVDPNPPADQLLPGWSEVVDENGGPSYYYHEEDGTTTWDRPVCSTAPESLSQEDAVLVENEYEPSELSMHHTLQQDSDSLHANQNGDVPAEVDPNPPADQLLPGWSEVADENGGPSYYYHEEDGTTTWDRPISAAGPTEPESSPQEDAVQVDQSGTSGLPQGWAQLTDPSTGRTYFYNEQTSETSWDMPEQQLKGVETNLRGSQTSRLHNESPTNDETLQKEPVRREAPQSAPPIVSPLERQADVITDTKPGKDVIGPPSAVDFTVKAPPASTPMRTTNEPKVETTPSASARVPPAPSSAPANLEAGSKKKKGGLFGLRSTFTRLLNPNAVVADTGDEMQAYYDKERKVWVFPGEDPAEKAAPIAPPPIIPRQTAVPTSVEEKTDQGPADPLSSMMAPPNRRGLPGKKPVGAKPAASSIPTTGAPPQFAVFTPK